MKRCWFTHSWTAWVNVARGEIYSNDRCSGWFVRQERRCSVCGKVQIRMATT